MKEVLAGIRGVRNRNLAELAATALSGPQGVAVGGGGRGRMSLYWIKDQSPEAQVLERHLPA